MLRFIDLHSSKTRQNIGLGAKMEFLQNLSLFLHALPCKIALEFDNFNESHLAEEEKRLFHTLNQILLGFFDQNRQKIQVKSKIQCQNSELFQCQICPGDRKFKLKKSYLKHLSLRHQASSSNFACHHCPKVRNYQKKKKKMAQFEVNTRFYCFRRQK